MLRPTVATPADLPVCVADAKEHAIVDFADDDTLLETFLASATGYLDGPSGVLGRAILDQTVVQKLPSLASMRLPYGPAREVTSVTYYDHENVEQAFVGFSLLEDEAGSFLAVDGQVNLPTTYARPDAVTVTYQAGWATVGAVPKPIKEAIIRLATTWYMQRETVYDTKQAMVPFGVDYLIAPFRRVGI